MICDKIYLNSFFVVCVYIGFFDLLIEKEFFRNEICLMLCRIWDIIIYG